MLGSQSGVDYYSRNWKRAFCLSKPREIRDKPVHPSGSGRHHTVWAMSSPKQSRPSLQIGSAKSLRKLCPVVAESSEHLQESTFACGLGEEDTQMLTPNKQHFPTSGGTGASLMWSEPRERGNPWCTISSDEKTVIRFNSSESAESDAGR